MRMLTTAKLISFRPDAHEAGEDPVEKRRKVAVQELTLTQAEVYQSGGDGLQPEAKLLIPYDRVYKGERELEYRGERWKVIRSDPYKEWTGTILLIRRMEGNARVYNPPEPVTNGNGTEVGADA